MAQCGAILSAKQLLDNEITIMRPQVFSNPIQKISDAHWDKFGKQISKMRLISRLKQCNYLSEMAKILDRTKSYLHDEQIVKTTKLIAELELM